MLCLPEHSRRAAVLSLWLLMATASAQAGTALVAGQLTGDDGLFAFGFDLAQSDTLTATTLSYGGSPAHGVAAGGFAPVLALFSDSAGLLQVAQGSANDCSAGIGAADPVSGYCWDARLTLAGAVAGHYTLVLSQDGNAPWGPTLADGYSQQGQPNYTSLYNFYGLPGSGFFDVEGRQRSSQFAIEISAPNSPAVPEPASAWTLLAGLAGLVAARRATRR